METEKILDLADGYVEYALKNLELDRADAVYVRNRVLEILSGADGQSERLNDAIYGALSLSPATVNAKFKKLCQKSTKKATDWFYGYCVKNEYVKKSVLDKNPRFEAEGLVITINKAKPEFRDPKKAAVGNSVNGGFARCVICRENEGFGERNKRTLRTVDITLGGQPWFWQYSPYGYFNEHGIAVNCEHVPMHVDKATFTRLMDFVDVFPHYFIGCNAPLPRIGGSVLAHDHYQGGGEILPMQRAGAVFTLKNKRYADAVAEVVDWAGTVVRVVSENRGSIEDICEAIREKWVKCDPEHNAVSPTVIKTARGYEMSVILRSNVTSDEFPDGVFHAHPEFHVIKKESIGLIEAQGLFILPGRLETELGAIERIIEQNEPLPPQYSAFKLIYDEVKAMGGDVHIAMRRELGSICNRILENTAVFKDKKQTLKFLTELGFEL